MCCCACQDYGLGYCANSLALGCDCLGHIHYFDAALTNSSGEPVLLKNAVCMHEEDVGLLWKHVEYRCGTVAEQTAVRPQCPAVMLCHHVAAF